MTDVVDLATNWRLLVIVVVVFGLMPGAMLRCIVRLFPRDDIRRSELIAELYAVPFVERPLWVAQQVEVATFEGLGARVLGAPTFLARALLRQTFRSQSIRTDVLDMIEDVPRRERLRWALAECRTARAEKWSLASGIDRNRRYPTTFWIPDTDEVDAVEPGDEVKLIFETSSGWTERMWVTVRKRRGCSYIGMLSNTPVGIPRLGCGDRVRFKTEHVIDIDIDAAGDL